jgi:hypothetical protein
VPCRSLRRPRDAVIGGSAEISGDVVQARDISGGIRFGDRG